jgi:S1-C subfamily serine protease
VSQKKFLVIPALVAILFAFGAASSGPVTSKAYNPDRVSRSILRITNEEGNSGGTGFAVRAPSDNVVIVTNDHVCNVGQAGRVFVRGSSVSMGQILKRDFEHDLCAVNIGPYAPSPLPVAERELNRFDAVFVQGHPLLMPQTPVAGKVIDRVIETIGFRPTNGTCPTPATLREGLFGSFCVLNMELMTTTLQIFPGNSGSPVLNEQGAIVGVINSADNRTGWGAYVQLNHLKNFLSDL